MKTSYHLPCNIAATLNIIGDKWSLLILHKLFVGHCTYKELQENLENIPTNLLSERLKSLEAEDLISSNLYSVHPPRYRYILTESGNDLQDVFNSLILWGEKHLKKCYKKLVHTDCGYKIQQEYYCPHCGKQISTDEISIEKMEADATNIG